MSVWRITRLPDGLVTAGRQPAIEQGKKERLFSFEMMIESALADPRFLTNIVNTRRSKTTCGEQLDGCIHNFGSGLCASLLHLSSELNTDPLVCFLSPSDCTVKRTEITGLVNKKRQHCCLI